MRFRAGDLVTLNLVDSTDLFAEAFGPDEGAGQPISHLTARDTAVVVSLSSHDGRCVYVVGPHGPGWTFGALLRRVK